MLPQYKEDKWRWSLELYEGLPALRDIVLCLFFFLSSNCVWTQPNAFWVIDTIYIPLPPFIGPEAYRRAIDLNTCSQSTDPTLYEAFFAVYGDYLDLTLPQLNRHFFVSGPGDGVPDNLLGTGVPYMYNPQPGPAFAPEVYPRAIASWYDNRIFFAGQGISYYNPATTQSRYLGDLPLFFQPEGPMTLREGSFYYPNLGRQLVQLRMVGDTFYHRLLPAVLPDTMNYGGILTIPHRCDSLVTYIIHRGSSWGSRLFVLDISDGTLTPRCPDFTYKIMTAAHRGENVTPPGCEPEFRLDALAASAPDRYDTICRGPHFLFDERSVLGASAAIDSIVLELLDTPDGPQESLEVPDLSALQISPAGSGGSLLRLRCAGFPDTEAFRQALRQAQYRHTSAAPTEGLRRIRFTLYYPHLPAQTATYYLSLSNEALRANAALTPPRCYGGQDGAISLHPSGGSPAYGVSWADGAVGPERAQLAAGAYALTLTDANGCRRELQLLLEQPDTLLAALEALSDTLCAPTGRLTAVGSGGVPPYTYAWSHGPADNPATGLGAGQYALTIYDAGLCEATAQYTLYARDTLRQSVSFTGCQGDAYTDAGWFLTRDTSFAQYYQTAAGCDSVFSLRLSFADTFNLTEVVALCQGQSVEIGGAWFARDTVVRLSLLSTQGCDSLRAFVVEVAENESMQTAYFCPGQTYEWNGRSLSEAGMYRDTFAVGGGCDSVAVLELMQRAAPTAAIAQEGSLCAQGGVQLSAAAAGAVQYLWSTGDTTPSIGVTAPGDYALTTTDVYGCSGEAATVVAAGGFTPYIRLLAPGCAGQLASVVVDSVVGDYPPYVLSLGGRSQPVPGRIDNLPPDVYEATLSDAAGCALSFSWDLSLQSPGTLYLPPRLELYWGDTLLLEPQANFVPAQANWTPPQGLAQPNAMVTRAYPTTSERYRLRLLDASGCVYEAQVVIEVRRPSPYYAPTAFSPNDDGANDAFELFPGTGVEILHFSVYNRWGARLANRNGAPLSAAELRWGGDDQPSGIYVYRLRYRWADGDEREATGEVLLVR